MKVNLTYLVAVLIMLLSCKSEKKETVEISEQNNESKELSVIDKHNKAVHVMDGIWMRDPFIQLNPDGYYYLSCTRQRENLKLDAPKGGIEVYRSKDLLNWESLGVIWTTSESIWGQKMEKRAVSKENKHGVKSAMIWAPEIHFINNKWVVLYTSNQGTANLMLSEAQNLKGLLRNHLEPILVDITILQFL